MKYSVSLCMLILSSVTVFAQSAAYGLKGGPTIGLQRWNNHQGNDPLIAYHLVAFAETANEGDKGALFAEVGYHIKGRGVHFRASVNPLTGQSYSARNFQLRFHNTSLSLGAKNEFLSGSVDAYYSLAVRLEYNLKTDLEIYEGFENGVNKFVYGINLGGGFEFPFSEFATGVIDLRFSPDLSRQIFVPPIQNWENPYTGRTETLREQSIKNIAFEISFGMKFLHKVVYID